MTATAQAENAPRTIRLKPSGLGDASYNMRVHHAQPTSQTSIDDILDPKYWVNVSRKMLPGDDVICQWEDFSMQARLTVIDSGDNWAKVALLPGYPLDLSGDTEDAIKTRVEQQAKEDQEYEVVFKGPVNKWSVIRRKDKEYITKYHQQRKSAEEFLADYKRSLMR